MIFNLRFALLIIIISIVLSVPALSAKPKMAIIIDDFGYSSPSNNVVRDFANLNETFSISIIPHTRFALGIDNLFNKTGKEIIIHLPLEAYSRVNEEKNTITLDMSIAEVKESVRNAFNSVPHALGISNHQGSAFTSDLESMDKLTEAVFGKTVYFIDSRTSTKSVACETCRKKGIPAFSRDVFLDNDIAEEEAIFKRFVSAVKIAEKRGYVIAVGHRNRSTYEAFRKFLQSPLSNRVDLVYPSQILDLIKQK